MAKKLKTTKSLVEWCDKQVAAGKTLSMGWEGGGDSGWVWFSIDGKQINDRDKESEYTEQLVDMMYDQLEYGSWAGEFSAFGEATYDSDQKAFVGIDKYGEDDTANQLCHIVISVPKELWFDSLEFNIEDDDAVVSVAFHITNGFMTPEHEQVVEDITKKLKAQVDKVIDAYCQSESDGSEYRSMWVNEILQYNQFADNGEGMIEHVITTLPIGITSADDKDVFMELNYEYDEQ